MTIQASELIFFEGEKHSLINVPSMPDSIIQEKSQEFYMESTACWRGYVGTWEIKDDKLYLVDLRSSKYELVKTPPIFADWITDKLMFTTGQAFEGDVARYIAQTHLNVANGLVVSSKNIKEDRIAVNRAILKSANTKHKLQSFLERDDD